MRFEVWAKVKGERQGQAQYQDKFVQGAELCAQDKIFVEARVSKDAHLYVLHCNSDRNLVRHPAGSSLEFKARERADVPETDTYFELDDVPGEDVIYVIASERELEQADPRLGAALRKARDSSGATADCGAEEFARVVAGLPAVPSSPARGQPASSPPPGSAPVPIAQPTSKAACVAKLPPPPTSSPPPPPSAPNAGPKPERRNIRQVRQRLPNGGSRGTEIKGGNGSFAMRADKDGIAVIRLDFEH